MLQTSAFVSMMVTFGSPEIAIRSFATSPRTGPAEPEMKRHRDLVHGLAVQLQRPHAPADQRARFDRAAQSDDANLIAVFDAELRREFRRHLDEHRRLQLREVRQEAAHAAGGVMLGEAISREDERETRIARRREAIFRRA